MLTTKMYFEFATSVSSIFITIISLLLGGLDTPLAKNARGYSTTGVSLIPKLWQVFLVTCQIIVQDPTGGGNVCDGWIQQQRLPCFHTISFDSRINT